MDDGAAELERLRERLYRPDPPRDAVAAYRSAREAAEPEAPPVPAPRRGARWPLAAIAVGVVAAAVAVGLAVPHPPDPRAAAPTPPAVPGTLLAERTSADAARALTLDAGDRVVAMAVRCRGAGTVTVRLDALAWTAPCTGSDPALGRSGAALGRFTLRVTAAPGVTWAVSVAVQEDHDGLGFAE